MCLNYMTVQLTRLRFYLKGFVPEREAHVALRKTKIRKKPGPDPIPGVF